MPDAQPSPDDPNTGNTTTTTNDNENSIPASEATPLLTAFTTFLTLAIHSLLFHRNLYPRNTFLTARAYNLPVQQSRHPGVCTWVNDAVAAVAKQLQLATLHRVVFAVHAPKSKTFRVLERWVFDVERLPEWGLGGTSGEAGNEDAGEDEDEQVVVDEVEEEQQQEVNWTDVNESLRGALRRLAYAAEKMPDLPAGCTFTLAVELRDEAPAPIGHPQDWIPSQPKLQPKTSSKGKGKQKATTPSQAITTPIRSVQAGPMFFECWIEQPAPEEAPASKDTSQNTTNASS